MKRMICLISGQMLPNYIPVNEPATCPDVLHAVFTPGDQTMTQRWHNLRAVLTQQFPEMKFSEVHLKDAYNPREIQSNCYRLLRKYLRDDWFLNATGGTKLMAAPAIEVFQTARADERALGGRKLEICYVETKDNNTLLLNADWTVTELPFANSIDLVTYFALYGQELEISGSTTLQESSLVWHLQKLPWKVEAGVKLLSKNETFFDGTQTQRAPLHEFDVMCIKGYQLFTFECKEMHFVSGNKQVQKEKRERVTKDLLKLLALRERFGGPFSKSYWVSAGSYRLSKLEEERAGLFRVGLIRQSQLAQVVHQPWAYGLPFPKPLQS